MSVPEATTRLAMLKRGEVDVAYLLEGQLGESIKERSEAEARLLRRHRHPSSRLLRHVGPEIALGRPARAQGGEPRDRPQGAERGRDARRLQAHRQHRAATASSTRCRSSPTRTIRRRRRSCWPRRAIRTGSTAAICTPMPPYFATGEAIVDYLGAVGIRMKLRTMERAAFFSAFQGEEAQGRVLLHDRDLRQRLDPHVGERAEQRHLRLWRLARHRRAVSRSSSRKRTARSARRCCTRSRRLLHERTRFAPIYDYFWPSGVGPRVEEASLMKIDPFPWSAPLEDVRLKRP